MQACKVVQQSVPRCEANRARCSSDVWNAMAQDMQVKSCASGTFAVAVSVLVAMLSICECEQESEAVPASGVLSPTAPCIVQAHDLPSTRRRTPRAVVSNAHQPSSASSACAAETRSVVHRETYVTSWHPAPAAHDGVRHELRSVVVRATRNAIKLVPVQRLSALVCAGSCTATSTTTTSCSSRAQTSTTTRRNLAHLG